MIAPMTAAEQKVDSIVEKITKLQAQAEGCTGPEAEAFNERVNKLMADYAIDQARIDAKKAAGQKEVLVEADIELSGSWLAPHSEMLQGICFAADIRLVVSTRGAKKIYHLLGFESDVQQARILFASLQLQSMLGLREYSKTNYAPSYFTAAEKYRLRRDYVFGFGEAAVSKIRIARATALKEAKERDKAAADLIEADPTAEPADVSTGTEVVLATKRERVDEFVGEKYPRLGRARGGNVQRGFGAANAAGRTDGQRANVSGRQGIGTGKQAIR